MRVVFYNNVVDCRVSVCSHLQVNLNPVTNEKEKGKWKRWEKKQKCEEDKEGLTQFSAKQSIWSKKLIDVTDQTLHFHYWIIMKVS